MSEDNKAHQPTPDNHHKVRIVPVHQSISTQMHVMAYKDVKKVVLSSQKILAAPCICRKKDTHIEKITDDPVDTCFVFGWGIDIYEDQRIGRIISQEEALKIMKKGVKTGLVPQSSSAQNPINICLCCGCCCNILKNIKKLKQPAKVICSSFQAEVEQIECTGCQACEEICPVGAINMDPDTITAQVDISRCVGCGLCISACHFNAMKLVDKIETEQIEPPADLVETYQNIAREKGLY